MDDITSVTITINQRYYTSAKTDNFGRRSMSAAIAYDRPIYNFYDETTKQDDGVIEDSGGDGTVEEIHERFKPLINREIAYQNYHSNVDMVTFIKDAIAFALQDSIEQRVRPINIDVKLAHDIEISAKMAQFIEDWFEVDPSINSVDITVIEDVELEAEVFEVEKEQDDEAEELEDGSDMSD